MAQVENLTLLTDLYQLTMAQAYFREQRMGEATFSLFIRSYPPNRGYFVSAGLKDVLEYLQNLSFDSHALDYLAAQKLFSEDFLHYLGDLKFTGDVWAITRNVSARSGEQERSLQAKSFMGPPLQMLFVQEPFASVGVRPLPFRHGRPYFAIIV